MRHATALVLALTCLGGLAPAARANDTTAELATGGLIFVTTDAVEMRSEKLFISARFTDSVIPPTHSTRRATIRVATVLLPVLAISLLLTACGSSGPGSAAAAVPPENGGRAPGV